MLLHTIGSRRYLQLRHGLRAATSMRQNSLNNGHRRSFVSATNPSLAKEKHPLSLASPPPGWVPPNPKESNKSQALRWEAEEMRAMSREILEAQVFSTMGFEGLRQFWQEEAELREKKGLPPVYRDDDIDEITTEGDDVEEGKISAEERRIIEDLLEGEEVPDEDWKKLLSPEELKISEEEDEADELEFNVKNEELQRARRAFTSDNDWDQEVSKELDKYMFHVLKIRRVVKVTKGANLISISAFVCVGNQKGVAGFGVAKGADAKKAVQKAFLKAVDNFVYIPTYDGTLFHNVSGSSTATTVHIRPSRVGMMCSDLIKQICECIGIKRLSVHIDGSTEAMNVTRAFFKALMKQETADEIAYNRGMNVIDLVDREAWNYMGVRWKGLEGAELPKHEDLAMKKAGGGRFRDNREEEKPKEKWDGVTMEY